MGLIYFFKKIVYKFWFIILVVSICHVLTNRSQVMEGKIMQKISYLKGNENCLEFSSGRFELSRVRVTDTGQNFSKCVTKFWRN